MPKRVIDLGGRPLLDIGSYCRAASVHRALTPSQRQQIVLTVRRAPEVMVKISGGARSLGGVEAHLAYIGRENEQEYARVVETDDGQRLVGRGTAQAIALDWDLDLEDHGSKEARWVRGRRRPFKLVHNIIFSMPPGTAPDKLLKAVRRFAVNQFALQHRYAFALHTDEPHPHVHLVVKAVSEQGERLNIRKATLRDWRQEFATHLGEQGIAANATERAVRGETRTRKKDPIYRAMRRNESLHEMHCLRELAAQVARAAHSHIRGKAKLEETRAKVVAGWSAVADRLHEDGNYRLAEDVRLFASRMMPIKTDQQQLAGRERHHPPAQAIDGPGWTR